MPSRVSPLATLGTMQSISDHGILKIRHPELQRPGLIKSIVSVIDKKVLVSHFYGPIAVNWHSNPINRQDRLRQAVAIKCSRGSLNRHMSSSL